LTCELVHPDRSSRPRNDGCARYTVALDTTVPGPVVTRIFEVFVAILAASRTGRSATDTPSPGARRMGINRPPAGPWSRPDLVATVHSQGRHHRPADGVQCEDVATGERQRVATDLSPRSSRAPCGFEHAGWSTWRAGRPRRPLRILPRPGR